MSGSTKNDLREVWQRGPVKNIPTLLQPIAHALLQAGEDAEKHTGNMDNKNLWEKPGGVASVGFHLQHIVGVLDRLFTYAEGNALNDVQLEFLKKEGNPGNEAIDSGKLLQGVRDKIQEVLGMLEGTDVASLTAIRYLGRAKIETTKMGLLFHAAEHVQRHIGQLLVTAKWVSQ